VAAHVLDAADLAQVAPEPRHDPAHLRLRGPGRGIEVDEQVAVAERRDHRPVQQRDQRQAEERDDARAEEHGDGAGDEAPQRAVVPSARPAQQRRPPAGTGHAREEEHAERRR